MSAFHLRLPESLHEAVREIAERENISMNQFIMLALAEKVSALATEDYLKQRAARASRKAFDAALDQVADVESPEYDRLSE